MLGKQSQVNTQFQDSMINTMLEHTGEATNSGIVVGIIVVRF